MNTKSIRTAFILGAGLGLRLRPLTANCPKPLLPIGGRPLITHAMDHLRTVGVKRYIINTHHCPEAYRLAFSDSQWQGIPVILRHEEVLLDTGGGLKNIEDLLDADERLIVYNGDIVTNLSLDTLLAAHDAGRSEVTLALRSGGPLLNAALDENGNICDLRHTLGTPGKQLCQFAGIYIAQRSFLKWMEAGRIESVVEAWLRMIRAGKGGIRGVVIDEGMWHDMGTVGEYERICNEWNG